MRLWRSFKPKIREIELHIFSGQIKMINKGMASTTKICPNSELIKIFKFGLDK